jgi:hypothetical protein
MSDHLHSTARALRHTVVHSPTSFTCCGQVSSALSPRLRREMTERTARSYLLSQLQAHLYSVFYVRGGIDSSAWESPGAGSDLTSFRDGLSAANTGTGCTQGGWTVLASSASEVVVRRGNGVRLMLRPEDCFAGPGAIPRPGSIVALHTNKELANASPGFYMAVSNRDQDHADAYQRLRVYWNLKPEGAVHLLRVCTQELNDRGLFFHLKVLNDPAAYSRCDAGVLYFQKADFTAVAAVLKFALPQLAPFLKREVPLFTKCLAPGVGFAEDPGGVESFGQHRCRIFADGIIGAYEQKARHLDKRLAIVADRFASAGICLNTPYLNPHSIDNYFAETRYAA